MAPETQGKRRSRLDASTVDTIRLEFAVNGVARAVEVPPQKTLLRVLREDLGLTGAKNGCDVGICGTCSVLVDGVLKKACIEPAAKLQGRRVLTVEGLGTPDSLSAVQQAFVNNTASQCGMCTSGFIVACHAYLEKNPHPADRDAIRTFLRRTSAAAPATSKSSTPCKKPPGC
jgi:aerobic-type carbon monoxide dehydrogenase small subunit (CoxS/CutS family)